jgi:hypothetical protein
MTDDVLSNKLRLETIEQMGYDKDNLLPWQDVRVTAVDTLKLALDRCWTEALAGNEIDPKSVASISDQLEHLLNPSFGGDSPEAKAREDREAQDELTKIITGLLTEREHESGAILAKLAVALDNHQPATVVSLLLDLLAVGRTANPVLDRVREMTADLITPGATADLSAQAQGQPPAPQPFDDDDPPPGTAPKVVYVDGDCTGIEKPQSAETDAERINRINSQPPPQHYLKSADPPWRSFVDENGIRTSGGGISTAPRSANRWSPRKDW